MVPAKTVRVRVHLPGDANLEDARRVLRERGIEHLDFVPAGDSGWVGRGQASQAAVDALRSAGHEVDAFATVTSEARSLVLQTLLSATSSGLVVGQDDFLGVLRELGPHGDAFLILLDDLEEAGWIQRELTTEAPTQLTELGARFLAAAGSGRLTIRWPAGDRGEVPLYPGPPTPATPDLAPDSQRKPAPEPQSEPVSHTIEVRGLEVWIDDKLTYAAETKGRGRIDILEALIGAHPAGFAGSQVLAIRSKQKSAGTARAIFKQLSEQLAKCAGFPVLVSTGPTHDTRYVLAPGVIPKGQAAQSK